MNACEKCWGDAYRLSLNTGNDQSTCYKQLLEERKSNPCSPREQAGQFWDEKLQRDSRYPETLPEKLVRLIQKNPGIPIRVRRPPICETLEIKDVDAYPDKIVITIGTP
jgi:hypothetical protein